MALVDSVIPFVVSLLVGALGIYIGARVIADVEDYTYAIVTALLGAIGWAIVAWIPLLGPIVALVIYVAVINYRYPGGWLDSIGIALIAWIASLVVLVVLAVFNVGGFDVVGVPGV